MDILNKNERADTDVAEDNAVTTYHEKVIGNKIYRVTGVYLGKIELAQALEDLTVRKILRQEYAL